MKVKDANKEKKPKQLGNIRLIPLDHIVDHPSDITNRAIDKEHVVGLKDSIMRDGLDTPLAVWDGNGVNMELEGGKEVPASFLIAGFHRRAALRKGKKEDKEAFLKRFPDGLIPCVVHTGPLEDALSAQLRENLARENPSTQDILPFVLRLKKEFKLKGKAIAKRIGRSEAWVAEVLSIEKQLGEDGVKEVIEGKVNVTKAVEAAKKVKKGKASKAEAIAEAKDKTHAKNKKKRVSLKVLFSRYKALPNLKVGVQKQTLEEMVEYALEDRNKVPELLKGDDDQKDKSKKKDKKGKKNKK